MHIDFLVDRFLESPAADAFVWQDQSFSYEWLADAVRHWQDQLRGRIPSNAVVSLEADFSPHSVALLLALIEHGGVIVPLAPSSAGKSEFRDIAQVEADICVREDGSTSFDLTGVTATHELLTRLKQSRHPGLVLFSSGSTGKSKAAVHDFVPLLEKFQVRRNAARMMAFLLFDHIGGVNTMFYALSNAGCLVLLRNRAPEIVCAAIEKHKVQVLPTSPTFLNLMLISGAYKRFDLSSLELVTYGTEVMPESTLARVCEVLPHARLQQTYGLSELGILRSKSRSSNSLWVKLGGEGFETRVVDGMLEVKARSAMLGYLNAPSPFTADGWFKTGDAVECDGEYFRIWGRKSELINVAGEKVYPAEVESVLQTMEGVQEAVVRGEPHPITGQIVTARIGVASNESLADLRRRMHEHCRGKLAKYKIPARIELVRVPLHSDRYKKLRASAAVAPGSA